VPLVLRAEGGFVNDPADGGGPTNHGITQATLAAWRKRPVTVDEVRALTLAEALAIYRANYWAAAGCDALPSGLDLLLFDMAVNAGPGTARKLLQRAGSGTTRQRIGAFTAAREAYYRSIVAARPANAKFLRGWLARARDMQARALGMA
jgi:lysozyme family protein